MSKLLFLTGPVRSGKSRHAVTLAREWGSGDVFVATYRLSSDDQEMSVRVQRHQAERPAWRTLEAPFDVASELEALQPAPTGVVLDSLTLWASDRFGKTDAEVLADWDEQLIRFRRAPWPIVIVGDEIGWSPVPPDAALRRFRDLVGTLAQRTAEAADEAWLLVAGCPVRLK